ncbi:MAG: hypothetical protein D6788_04140, partial [Planctomycetota bacterium]
MSEASSLLLNAFWRHGLAVLPPALLFAALSRWLPLRPATRHLTWAGMLAWLLAAPLLPEPPARLFPSAGDDSAAAANVQANGFLQEEEREPRGDRQEAVADMSRDDEGAVSLEARDPVNGVFRAAGRSRPATGWTQGEQADTGGNPPVDPTIVFAGSRSPSRLARATDPVEPFHPLADDPASNPSAPPEPKTHENSRHLAASDSTRRGVLPADHPSDEDIAFPSQDLSAPGSTVEVGTEAANIPDAGAKKGTWNRFLTVPVAWVRATAFWMFAVLAHLPPLPVEVWLVGATAAVAIGTVRRRYLYGVVKRSIPAPPAVRAMVEDAARPYGLRRLPDVRMVGQRLSPMIWAGRRLYLI